jgi:FkbM family methyltransferase
METDFAGADCYWKFLESTGVNLKGDVLSRMNTTLESTSWDSPTSATELNNVAVAALIEAENSQDTSLRNIYLEMALEALNEGAELRSHPLCTAHLALVFAMTGEIEQATQLAFSTFVNTLQPAYVNEQAISPSLVYLPPSNSFIDTRSEKLTKILQAEDVYTQSLLLLSEVLCHSQLVFYNIRGLRFLHLYAQLFPSSYSINLKLGVASLINAQQEGILYLHRARCLKPNQANILQALYLAYRDLGEIESAKLWLNFGCNIRNKDARYLDLQWSELAPDSNITYLPFESKLLLAVEPSLRSLVTSVLIAEGDWFEKEMEFWRSRIKPGMTVIDVGANVGVYTFSAALRVGSEGCVLAVEPFSGCTRCLQETCRLNQLSWVKVCAGAASDRNGTARLALHTASELNEVVSSDAEETMKPGTFEEVTCFTLDSLIERENVSHVDFLKIDAEGHELQVLEGSNRILTEFAPCILYENIAGTKGSNLAVAGFLLSRGYQLFRYQPYLQQLIPINHTEELQGKLNLIALPTTKPLDEAHTDE